ncbi:MAG: serine/threonine protein kinase [Oscillospiraceae bacterium]|nr:serine/threonine protein kinase [Oscillospiraceae bacterium]
MYGKQIEDSSYINETYHIETKLGLGGSGVVYKAWHKRLQKHVVIKVVKDCAANTIELQRNEVEALKNIKSMHVPQVLDFITEDGNNFTVMEYIEGRSFDRLLGQGKRFGEDLVHKWYCQLASALDAIHKHDVCHRDIKPSNIIYTISEDVCLIDFNSALVVGNHTGVISRSMGYASPEQYKYFTRCKDSFVGVSRAYSDYIETALLVADCKTEPVPVAPCAVVIDNTSDNSLTEQIDWKLSDIYSLGATMYHFLTGMRPPVKVDDVARIPELRGYSEDILKIIERSMRTDPSKRFSSAKELVYNVRDAIYARKGSISMGVRK